MEVIRASLDDTAAISALLRSQISAWQRMDTEGRVSNVAYEALTVGERWLHGDTLHAGPWMSVETAAIYLNHLLLGAGLVYVAKESSGQLIGYAEAYHSSEFEPFGQNVHLAHLIANGETASALVAAVAAEAKRLKCARLTTTNPEVLSRVPNMKAIATGKRASLAARQGQVFYRVVDQVDANAAQIAGWAMPVGRLTSARHQWELRMGRLWDTLPELRARRAHRLRFSAGGQDALVVCKQGAYDPRSADVFVWTPKLLTPPIVSGLRDWAHREGYRTLWFTISEQGISALGAEAEFDGSTLTTHALDVK